MKPAKRYPPVAWGALPLVPVVVALMLGVLLADAFGFTGAQWWLSGGVLTFIAALALHLLHRPERWVASSTTLLLLLTVVAFGGWRAASTHLPGQADFFVKHQQTDDLLAGSVTAIRPARKTLRAEVILTHLLRKDSTQRNVSGRVVLYLSPDEAAAQLRPHDRIVFGGLPDTLSGPQNPGVFDLRAYWKRQHVYHQKYLGSSTEWRRIPHRGLGLSALAQRCRSAWFRTFQEFLSGDNLAVATALVLGDRSLISREVKSAYTETGSIHVLAVSGLHVGIIFLLLRFLFVERLKLDRSHSGRIVVAVVSIACIWAFAFVSGLSASVQRAALMFSVLALGNIRKVKGHVFNTLSLAAIGMLVWDPVQLFRTGFQLSFTAIVGIVAFTNFIDRAVYLPGAWVRKTWSAMAASVGAQLGTLPLSLLYFRQFPVYFLLSGTAVVISAFVMMTLGIFHGALFALTGPNLLTAITGTLLDTIVGVQNAFIFYCQSLPNALWKLRYFDVIAALLLSGSIISLAVFVRWRRWLTLVMAAVLLLSTVIWARTQVPGEKEAPSLTLYHLRKATLLDIVSADGMGWSVGDQPPPEDLDWSAGPNRRYRAYQPLATFPLPLSVDTTLAPGLTLTPKMLSIGASRWCIPGAEKTDSIPAQVTHVLVTEKLRASRFPALPAASKPLLLLDGSVPRYRFAEWRALAEELGLPLWITEVDGAYVWPPAER